MKEERERKKRKSWGNPGKACLKPKDIVKQRNRWVSLCGQRTLENSLNLREGKTMRSIKCNSD